MNDLNHTQGVYVQIRNISSPNRNEYTGKGEINISAT